MTPSGARGAVEERGITRARARESGAGPGILIEGIQEGSRRRDFESSRGGRRTRVGRRGKSNVAGNTDRFIVTNVTLVTESNAPLAYDPGL